MVLRAQISVLYPSKSKCLSRLELVTIPYTKSRRCRLSMACLKEWLLVYLPVTYVTASSLALNERYPNMNNNASIVLSFMGSWVLEYTRMTGKDKANIRRFGNGNVF
ncbi:hypothetical protein PILCRDRAFT_644631 [Piloderma croceum F 1598]|uniref:Uncharacterized protein n=1 Tax=Piloderma croceum (strain F 1598) TaxID=765440 RepID=A0A0C3EVE5_PILCF|nr:hypothetical protein PILCRDRAFT_644631 [Piloderma croceum F 1598]